MGLWMDFRLQKSLVEGISGIKDYQNNEFSECKFHEKLTEELKLQIESIREYGGFYISRYNISKDRKTVNPQSVKGEKPWVNINFNEARKLASIIENNEVVKSHITFGAEYDSVLEFFIKSNARTYSEIVENSTNWGNYCNTKNSPRKIVETGTREEWSTNNICDFAGNVNEWTQELYGTYYSVIRGGDYSYDGDEYPAAYRHYGNPFDFYGNVSFRTTLYIRP